MMPWIAITALAGAVYFTPTIVALSLDRRNKLAIAALNALLGWTIIGWVMSLVWALTKDGAAL